MYLKPLQIDLSTDEVQKVLAIALDESPTEALAFIRNVLARRVEKALQPH